MKLIPEVKTKWVAALRSGEYPQTLGLLHRLREGVYQGHTAPVGFCCLGVLAEIQDVAKEEIDYKTVAYHFDTTEGEHMDEANLPTDWFIARFEECNEPIQIDLHSTLYTVTDVADHLVGMNDNKTPFSNIADWIEQNL